MEHNSNFWLHKEQNGHFYPLLYIIHIPCLFENPPNFVANYVQIHLWGGEVTMQESVPPYCLFLAKAKFCNQTLN